MIFYKKQVESNMKVTPIISILMTNEETKNDQLVKDIFFLDFICTKTLNLGIIFQYTY